VPVAAARRAAHLPPVSTLFAAFLGYDPVQHLIGTGVLSHLSVHQQAVLTGRSFFPGLITAPFKAGLDAAFDFAILASLVAAGASWMRGGRYVYVEPSSVTTAGQGPTDTVEGSPVTGAVLTAASGTTTARDGNR
jgi:hypothetical protein